MMIPFDLKIFTISLVVLICLDNFVVLGQQKRNCGTKFDAIKAADFVATSSDELKIYEMPWMVSIVKKIKPDVAACSGTLVSSKYIISAAHCFKHLPKEAFEVILGTDNLTQHPNNFQPYQKKFNLHKLYKHPSYEGKYHNDVAIIELENDVTFSDGIFPICLPERETPTNERAKFSVTLAGFGSTGSGKNQELRFATLQINTQSYCNSEYQKTIGEANLFTSSNIICAGSIIQGIGSCDGDSGGPLMEKLEGGIIEQIAVTKGGVARTACGSFPGIYTRLDDPEVFRWMQSVIFGIVQTTTSIPEPCGILSRDDPFGLFGTNQWPWMVTIKRNDTNGISKQHCSGTIISKKLVLTAASCLNPNNVDTDSLGLVFGSDQGEDQGFFSDERNINRTFIHPSFDGNSSYYDVALIEVDDELEFDDIIQPICLPQYGEKDVDSRENTVVLLNGNGEKVDGDTREDSLSQSIQMTIYSQSFCNRSYTHIDGNGAVIIDQKLPRKFQSNLLCAGSRIPGEGLCHGDSGRPLVTFQAGVEPFYELVGVSVARRGSCGSIKYPGIFVRLEDYNVLDWIANIMTY